MFANPNKKNNKAVAANDSPYIKASTFKATHMPTENPATIP